MSCAKRLFLVDDEAIAARIVRTSLQREGYEVTTFPNGLRALEALRIAASEGTLPDGLITDIEMPVMTGEELCKNLESEQPNRRYPIFVVTSVPDQIHREWTSSMAEVYFVEKPVSIRQLTDALRSALEDQPQ